ncbi:MAG TPA: UDP-N-acetylmuramoyl-L-alanyl-D-glutamate--2,6-diaminopimelate ligase [Saprospiraceae bacterium]|nr:UDP-N-acetylmuramoyl-L-alanyl-D-glutamate--2,6-diaminopimelate ligase [Saprospiraceae bacterium]
MTIKELIVNIRVKEIRGDENRVVESIHSDSRRVEPGSVFIAVKGRTTDGHKFIDNAVDRGAICVIAEEAEEKERGNVCVIIVEDSTSALAEVAAAFYGYPSKQLVMVGVTGTNGKTTIATLLYRLFTELGHKSGLLSTIENRIGDQVESTKFTTPDAISIQEALSRMVSAGCTHAFMEVSSHSLDQRRVEGIEWDGAVFSNITHDHLDYHGDFASYIQAKKIFFDGLSAQAFALINTDDKHAEVMVQNTVAKVSNYSLTKIADFRARVIENRIDGLHLELNGIPLHVRLVGKFNASNLLAIYGTAILLGEDQDQVLTGLSRLQPAEGRFDLVTGRKQVFAVVDYAHTPDALHNVLSTLIQVRKPGSHIICIVGCGGDRDKTKRPEMARIAASYADQVILTSDNPRTENPDAILDQMWTGVANEKQDHVLRITDRREAIRAGVLMAKPGDILLVAGKGHEKYQEINGHRYPFDDKKVLAEALA